VISRILAKIMGKLPPTSTTKRDLLTVAFWHLQDVAYTRLRDRGFAPGGILDIGAHDGRWALSIQPIFPNCPIILFEARPEQAELLSATCSRVPNSKFIISLLGAEIRDKMEFSVHGSASSLFSERSNAARKTATLSMHTLDEIMNNEPAFAAPLFLKLDVQGGELEILKGAKETLKRAEIVQLEVALLNYNQGAPLAAETVAFMEAVGFCIYDIVGFVRPKNVDLVQVDIIFARKDSKLRPEFFTF
jgi:FkbM family methyltransferase